MHLIILKLEISCYRFNQKDYIYKHKMENHNRADVRGKCTNYVLILFSDSVPSLEHHHAVPSDDNHSWNVILSRTSTSFSGIISITYQSDFDLLTSGTQWHRWARGSWMGRTHTGFPQPTQGKINTEIKIITFAIKINAMVVVLPDGCHWSSDGSSCPWTSSTLGDEPWTWCKLWF